MHRILYWFYPGIIQWEVFQVDGCHWSYFWQIFMLLHVSLCIFPSVWWLRIKLQWTFAWRFVWTYAFVCLFKFVFFLCKFLSMKILDCILSVCLIQKRKLSSFFPKWVYHIAFQLFGRGGWCTMLVVYGSFCPWLYFCKSCKHTVCSGIYFCFNMEIANGDCFWELFCALIWWSVMISN